MRQRLTGERNGKTGEGERREEGRQRERERGQALRGAAGRPEADLDLGGHLEVGRLHLLQLLPEAHNGVLLLMDALFEQLHGHL